MADSISPADLQHLLDEGANIKVLDVRLRQDRVDVDSPILTADWRDPEKVAEWCDEFGDADEVIVFCVHGHHVSQSTRDALRARGVQCRIIDGGIEAWRDYRKKL